MLIGAFCGIALLCGALVCAAFGFFESFLWLAVLPAVALVAFLALAGLWYLLILIMSKIVDMESEQTGDSFLYRWVIQLTVASVIPLLGVRVHTKGFEQELPEGRFLLVCNHLHDFDPAFLLRAFPKSQLAFIAKQEVRQMPLIGPLLKKIQGQFVNRENDREALKCIIKCISIIKDDKASVAVFPEGWIKEDRKLRPFRPGVFKIAQKAKVPVVVCTLQDTHKAMPKVKKLQGADVHLHLVGIIPAEELEGVTTVDIAHRAYDMMAKDLGPELVFHECVEST